MDGKISEYPYNNSPITIQVPDKVKYSITLGDIEDYATPIDSNTYTATAGASRNLSYTYNACRLTFNFIPTTATAKLSHKNTTVTNGSSILVPYSSITITPDDIEGYQSPNSINITPSTPSQTISMEWNEARTEIKIVDNSGNLVDIDSWTGGSNATGVLFSDGSHKFIIAPDEWYGGKRVNNSGDVIYEEGESWNGNGTSAWGGYGINVAGCTSTPAESESNAILDFSGESNTIAIINQLSGVNDGHDAYCYTGAPAAEYCRAYSRGCKGAGQWYLPAAGELNQIILNKDEINRALIKISGKVLGSVQRMGYGIWSSTQSDYEGDILAWSYLYEDNMFLDTLKVNGYDVRPICKHTASASAPMLRIYSDYNLSSYIDIDLSIGFVDGATSWFNIINNHETMRQYFTDHSDTYVYTRQNAIFNWNDGTTLTTSIAPGKNGSYHVVDKTIGSSNLMNQPVYLDHIYYITTQPG